MPPVQIKLDTHYEGDSWAGMLVGPIVINEAQPANPLASVRMQFRDVETDELAFELNTSPGAGEGTITITNANTWEIEVPTQLIGLEAGRYNWDFQCTDSSGFVITTYKGIFRVTEDVTHD